MPFSATRDLWLVLKARDEATGAMRAFSRDIRMVGDSVKEANLRAARSAIQNEMATRRLADAYQISQLRKVQQTAETRAEIQAIQDEGKVFQLVGAQRISGIDKELRALHTQRAAMEENRVTAQKMSSVYSGLSSAMAAFGTISVAASALGVAGLKSLVNASVDYQKQSSLTRTQVDKFATSLEDIEKIGLRVADSIGVSFDQIQPALFDIFSSMEVSATDAEKLLKIFAKAAVAGQTDIQNASKATIGILNAFQLPLTYVNHLMDVQFQLVKEGIGTYEEWSQRIGLVTPSAVRFGQSVDMMAAALAASTRMGISAARSATSVSRAMDAMSNPKAVENLKALGINAYNAQGKFRPMIDILKDFRAKLQSIPNADRIKAILDVFKGAGGTIEARRFLQNMLLTPGNLELFQKILGGMSGAAGSFEQAYQVMADTTATKSELLANKWQEVKIAAGTALIPSFMAVINFATKLFDKFNNLSPATKTLIIRIVAITAVLVGLMGVAFLVASAVLAFAAAMAVADTAAVAFVITVGGVLGAIAGLVTLFTILMVKSEGFRKSIANLANQISTFYTSYVLPTAKAIGDAWSKYVAPPLATLTNIIQTKVLPAFNKFASFMTGEFVSGLKSAGNIVKTVVIAVFHYLGEIIQNYLIPAIKKLNEFYHDHESTIKMIVKWLATGVKWFLITVGVIIAVGAVVIGVLVVAFGAAILAIGILIGVIVQLVQWGVQLVKWFGVNIPKAWHAVADTTVKVWNSILNFFVGLWNSIIGFFKSVWATIQSIFTTVMNAVAAAWNYFWNSSIGQLVFAVLKFIYSLIELIFYAILFVIEYVIKAIMFIIVGGWTIIKNIAIAVWGFIGPYIIGIWNVIKAVATAVWTAVSSTVSTAWNAIKRAVLAAAMIVYTYVVGTWNNLKKAVSVAWNAIVGTIKNAMSSVWDAVSGVWQHIKDFFAGAGKWLMDAGKAIIQGLIDGITSMINKVTGKIKEVTGWIKDHLPFSPAKKGPLSGRGNPFYSGQSIVKLLAAGMQSQLHMIPSIAGAVAARTTNLTGGMNTAISNSSGSGRGGHTNNQSITINTNEINPRRHAAELGRLLAGAA